MPQFDLEEEPAFGREVAQEVEFLESLMGLRLSESILDVASGAGRHALELARRGYKNVTALDISDQLMRIGARTAEAADLQVEFVKGDARTVRFDGVFDAALILGGGAFGLMEDDDENQKILDATYEALKPGGRVVVSGMSLLWLIRTSKDLSGYDTQTGYLKTQESVNIEGSGEEKLPLNERYFVFPGLKRQMEQAGFRSIMGFGAAPGRYSSRSISVEDPEILLFGKKAK
ncbi:MAG: class I SAM-dependent methyltransferase [Candidatus Eisenbacteria bacterium]|uniref:Class I SAM-dependent methyltransferase n=1 Tax=Eiseniibacteriota bacterium TaxID=2212470 RepID=A0A7Y2H344_UNCEI|nr:class I SAM-dependent methyltransferase [Candidatus Eisenbacteria bacterium]